MGSNRNRFFDKGMKEWGYRSRKEEARVKKKALQDAAIEDGLVADEDADVEDDGLCVMDEDGHCICEPEPHRPIPKRRKKDKKRWCRGKVGREHAWDPFMRWPGMSIWRCRSDRCTLCGKERTIWR